MTLSLLNLGLIWLTVRLGYCLTGELICLINGGLGSERAMLLMAMKMKVSLSLCFFAKRGDIPVSIRHNYKNYPLRVRLSQGSE